MCRMLLSINPEFVSKILDGSKTYEFRKTKCRSNINKVLIYSTSPCKKIVAEADILEVLEDEPLRVWEITKKQSGISYNFFRKYYKGKKNAIAYHLKNVKAFDVPIELEEYGISYAPQSFCYVD